jgi:two-component system nitrogen regulation sensor histidine kinase NtrY
MIFKNYHWRTGFKVLLLFASVLAGSLLFVKGWLVYEILVLPVILYQLYDFYILHTRTQNEVADFVEAIRYRDFSRRFNVKKAPLELQSLRHGFNEINTAFKNISQEKETQYQYLQKILELVNTGILSYEEATGEVMWMNEAVKQLLQLPYLRSVQSLQRRDAALMKILLDIQPGESLVTRLQSGESHIRVLLSATAFRTEDRTYKLVAFQNVNEALDETEAQAWQKLLRVMTHEIMNSVAPISSLAGTLKAMLHAPDTARNNSWLDDLNLGIETIQRRSEGLLKFTETYRNLNKISTPHITEVFARDLFETLYTLMEPTLDQKHIELDIVLKDLDAKLQVDISLIEQVLINLVLNAIDALKEQPQARIVLSAYERTNGKPVIQVSDNGEGMSEEILDKIFVPFFSTKKTGSGIGLNLCRQIMLMHKGNIQVQSKHGEGTSFLLLFG